ncbi:MAG: phage adaptor protein [Candidatus Thorarchaeota archaeon]|jgi:DNA polymerase III psi subunit
MALTLAQATTDVRQLLNESTAAFWTDVEIQDWLLEGTGVVASKSHSVEAEDDLTLVANQLIYTSSDHTWIADVLVPYTAIYDNGSNKYKGLELVHAKQIGNLLTFTSGDPRYMAFHNRSIYIWPLPSTSTASNTVSVLYAKETTDFTELKDEFQHIAILWAQIRAYEKDQKWQTANALKQQLYSELNFEKADKIMRQGEGTQAVKTGQATRNG